MTRLEPSPHQETAEIPPILSVPGLLLVAVLGLFVWVLFRQLGIVIPIVCAFMLLWRTQNIAWKSRITRLVIVLGSLWILSKARMVVYPLLFAILVAYWCDPLVRRLERRRIPRSLGALIAIVPALAIGVAFVLFLLPILIDQLVHLAGAVPGIWDIVSQKVQAWVAYVMPAGWQPNLKEMLKPLESHLADIMKGIVTSFSTVARGIGALLGFIGMIVLAPVLTYYVLADFDRVGAWVQRRIPVERKEGIAAYVAIAERTFRAYFRGQVLVSLCVGVFWSVGLTICGAPYSILLGFIAGILNLVPILGFWISVLLFVLSAFLSGHPGPLLLRIAILLIIQQALDSQVLTPRIVGRAVGLHPAFTLLSVLVFGAILGPVGVLVAVPAAAMIRGVVELRAQTREDPRGASPSS